MFFQGGLKSARSTLSPCSDVGLGLVLAAHASINIASDLLASHSIDDPEQKIILEEGTQGAMKYGTNIAKVEGLRKDFLYMMAPLLPYGAECRIFKAGTMSCEVRLVILLSQFH